MRHVERQLNDYLEGGLAPARRERVERHLAACTRCAAELGALRRTVAGLRGLPELEAPPGLADAVMRRVRSEEQRRGLGPWLRGRLSAIARQGFAPPLAAAATAALAIVVIQSVDIRIALPSGGDDVNTLEPALETPIATRESEAEAAPAARRAAPMAAPTSPSTLAGTATSPSRLAGTAAAERLASEELWTPPLPLPEPLLAGEGRCADPDVRDPVCLQLRLRALAGRSGGFELLPPPLPFPQPAFGPQPGRGLPAGFERATAPTR